jgi:hypothetical protein
MALAAAPAAAGVAQGQEARPAAQSASQILTDLVRLRFGRHLSEEQMRRAGERIAGNQRAAEALARVALQNSDEPAFLFSADVL